jgi:hypothetical protein
MDLAKHRLLQQRLLGAPCARPEDVVEGLLAVQAQDFQGAKWALSQRTEDADDASAQQAYDEGRILRTHVLRPTWHFVSRADIRWLLELSAPRVHAVNAYFYRYFGVDSALGKRSNSRIVKALERGGHLTRRELGRELGALAGDAQANGVGDRLACLLMRAELDGLICSGTMRGKHHTYALLEERAPPSAKLGRDEALATLARRYVDGHGPAQARDLAWWSGFTIAEAKRALEACGGSLTRTTLEGKTYFLSAAPPVARRRGPVVHLLPNYDELVVAFKDRSALLDPSVTPTSGVSLSHSVLVDGRIVGTWRRAVAAREIVIAVRLLRPLSSAEQRELGRAAARCAKSLGLACRLENELVPRAGTAHRSDPLNRRGLRRPDRSKPSN